MDHNDLTKLFFPESVVVCGVSDRPGNLGVEVLKNLDRFAFSGRIYGLGRKATEIARVRVYEGLSQLPETPDLAVILVPARAVPELLQSCGRAGVRAVVIETGGFSEFGADGKRMEEEIGRIASEYGITCMGPNCVGIINKENGLCLPFVAFDGASMRKGRNSFISQSGGLIHEMMRRCLAEHVGLSKLVSIGNKLMVDGNDVLDFFLRDQDTGVVGMYLEDAKSGRRLMELASKSEKPVIALKGNTSPTSREIASFHTAALLGDEGVLRAAFRQAGIHQVLSLQEMVDCFKIFSLPPMKGPNLLAVTHSGGQAVILADEAHRRGFVLPPLPPVLARRVREESKAGVVRSTNPLDLGDVFNDAFFLEVIEMAMKEPGIDGIVFFYDYPFNLKGTFEVAAGLERPSLEYGKPIVFCMVPDKRDWFARKEASPLPWFCDPAAGLAALRHSLTHYRKKAGPRRVRSFEPLNGTTTIDASSSSRALSPSETFSLMRAYGVPLVSQAVATSRKEGLEAAHRMGYPIAVKAAEPFILHKTETGAVRLGIDSDEELRAAFDAIAADVYLLQAMAADGVETIIGAKRDAEFGPVVMFGLGGIFAEVLKDVTVRAAPIDEEEAREMIAEIRGAALLNGARGSAPADKEVLVRALVGVSRLFVDREDLLDLDINPFRVFAEGRGAAALDVKIACTLPKASS